MATNDDGIRLQADDGYQADDEAFAENVTAALKEQPALTTDEEIGQIEKAFGAPGDTGPGSWGMTRRMALVTLTESGGWLIEKVTEDRAFAVAWAATMNAAGDYAEKLKHLAELMDRAAMRIGVALAQREDMTSVLAEARGRDRH